ncbi:MAG: hypothetical protein IPF66_22575 [Holophagales bacterium]|nr:hypothetical protein [Holophagales bacterium]
MKPGRSLAAMAVLAVAMILGPSANALAQAPRMAESAAKQVAALRGIKESRSASDRKVSSRLYNAVLFQRADPRLAALPTFRFVKPNADGTILVDIDTTIGAAMKPIMSAIDALGGSTTSASARYRAIRARVPLDKITTLATRTDVLKIQLAQPMLTNKINTSEGDVTHRAAAARNFFGVDGTGMKVCVLSDGVDSLAALQASGDLPAVDVLPGQAGTGDEGSAMLEIIHDLAPGATLGFATAFSTPADFAQNIQDLRFVAGCDVIVDDIIYLYESPFQDLEIAEAVNTVTADGALYFSSAGNEGNKNDGTSGTGRRLRSERSGAPRASRRNGCGPRFRRRRAVDHRHRRIELPHPALGRPVRDGGERLRRLRHGPRSHHDLRRLARCPGRRRGRRRPDRVRQPHLP